MVHQPVDGGQGHRGVGEDAVPIAEGLICCDGDGASLVSRADQFKQDAGFGVVLGNVGEVIENDQMVFVEARDGGHESKFAASDLQFLDQICGLGEEHAPSILDEAKADGGSQMGFSAAGRSEQDQVGASLQPTGPRMRSALKAKLCQIKLIDKQINHPNQMILANPVLKTFRKQRHLIPINPTNETRHK